MADDSDYTPEYINGRRVGPPACRWHEVNISAFGWSSDDPCNRPSTLNRGTLLLCGVHIKAIAKMSGYMTPEAAEELVRNRRKTQVDRLTAEIARLRNQVAAMRNAEPVRRKRPVDGIIYFLRVGGLIKIGWTGDLERRMRDYQPDSRLPAARSLTWHSEGRKGAAPQVRPPENSRA